MSCSSRLPEALGGFELIDSLGSVAHGAVYKARDSRLGRLVALKTSLATGEELERFIREARSVAQLNHPAIVPIYEVGQADGLPYLVCEFVAGITLADRLTAGRPSRDEAARWVADVADGLQYAHDHGVIHRLQS